MDRDDDCSTNSDNSLFLDNLIKFNSFHQYPVHENAIRDFLISATIKKRRPVLFKYVETSCTEDIL